MRTFLFIATILLAARANAYEHFLSPDRRLEAYTTANFPNGTGMKLFLRRARTRDTGLLLWQNGHRIDAKWSPDSHFLAVIDHPDGHIADVYVFGVTAADAVASPTVALFYHTPNPYTYDVKWELVSWRMKARKVVFRQEVRDQTAGTHATHKVTAKIGTKRLRYERPKET